MADRLRMMATVVLLAVATGAGALSMARLVEVSSWLTPMALVVTCAGVVLALGRVWSRSVWLPTLLAAVAGSYLLAALFTDGQGAWAPLPGLQAPEQLIALFRQGVEDAATNTAPVLGSQGLALTISAAAMLVLLLAELLAVGCRAPAWSGIALLAPWIPAVALGEEAPVRVFVVAAAAYLGVLVVHAVASARPAGGGQARRRTSAGWGSAATMAATTLVAAVVAAPAVLMLPAPTWQAPGGGSGATRLDLGLEVQEHLTRGADELLYSYRADDPETIGPLHAYTLTHFTGQRWQRADGAAETSPVGTEVLWPEQVDTDVDQTLQIRVLDLAQDRLLLPDEPRRLTIGGDWVYDPERDEVIGSGDTPLEYEAQIHSRDLDPAALNAAPAPDPDELDPQLLDVPDTGHQEQIAALTERIIASAGAQTPYEQAVAIQDHLRHDSHFTYDVEVDPARTSDAVWDFLGSGRGYCVQFATAMVVMARTQGIPARMAVGFLEGEEGADGEVEVSGHRAHTWPQLYFSGAGWIRFEPTPPARTGTPPEWAAGLPEDVEMPDEQLTPEELEDEPGTEGAQSPAPETAGESPQAGADQVQQWWPWLTVVLLAAAAAGGGLWWRQWWRRSGTVEGSWMQIRRAAAPINRDEANRGETPRALTRRVGLSGSAGEALEQLASAVEQRRYNRPGTAEPEAEDIRRWRSETLTALRERTKRDKVRS